MNQNATKGSLFSSYALSPNNIILLCQKLMSNTHTEQQRATLQSYMSDPKNGWEIAKLLSNQPSVLVCFKSITRQARKSGVYFGLSGKDKNKNSHFKQNADSQNFSKIFIQNIMIFLNAMGCVSYFNGAHESNLFYVLLGQVLGLLIYHTDDSTILLAFLQEKLLKQQLRQDIKLKSLMKCLQSSLRELQQNLFVNTQLPKLKSTMHKFNKYHSEVYIKMIDSIAENLCSGFKKQQKIFDLIINLLELQESFLKLLIEMKEINIRIVANDDYFLRWVAVNGWVMKKIFGQGNWETSQMVYINKIGTLCVTISTTIYQVGLGYNFYGLQLDLKRKIQDLLVTQFLEPYLFRYSFENLAKYNHQLFHLSQSLNLSVLKLLLCPQQGRENPSKDRNTILKRYLQRVRPNFKPKVSGVNQLKSPQIFNFCYFNICSKSFNYTNFDECVVGLTIKLVSHLRFFGQELKLQAAEGNLKIMHNIYLQLLIQRLIHHKLSLLAEKPQVFLQQQCEQECYIEGTNWCLFLKQSLDSYFSNMSMYLPDLLTEDYVGFELPNSLYHNIQGDDKLDVTQFNNARNSDRNNEGIQLGIGGTQYSQITQGPSTVKQQQDSDNQVYFQKEDKPSSNFKDLLTQLHQQYLSDPGYKLLYYLIQLMKQDRIYLQDENYQVDGRNSQNDILQDDDNDISFGNTYRMLEKQQQLSQKQSTSFLIYSLPTLALIKALITDSHCSQMRGKLFHEYYQISYCTQVSNHSEQNHNKVRLIKLYVINTMVEEILPEGFTEFGQSASGTLLFLEKYCGWSLDILVQQFSQIINLCLISGQKITTSQSKLQTYALQILSSMTTRLASRILYLQDQSPYPSSLHIKQHLEQLDSIYTQILTFEFLQPEACYMSFKIGGMIVGFFGVKVIFDIYQRLLAEFGDQGWSGCVFRKQYYIQLDLMNAGLNDQQKIQIRFQKYLAGAKGLLESLHNPLYRKTVQQLIQGTLHERKNKQKFLISNSSQQLIYWFLSLTTEFVKQQDFDDRNSRIILDFFDSFKDDVYQGIYQAMCCQDKNLKQVAIEICCKLGRVWEIGELPDVTRVVPIFGCRQDLYPYWKMLDQYFSNLHLFTNISVMEPYMLHNIVWFNKFLYQSLQRQIVYPIDCRFISTNINISRERYYRVRQMVRLIAQISGCSSIQAFEKLRQIRAQLDLQGFDIKTNADETITDDWE